MLTGTIEYPAVKGLPASTGKLVVAKASLTPDMPYEVLAYAQSNPVFPHDSTAEQWFDVGQFDASQAVGRHIGHAAAGERRRLTNEQAETNWQAEQNARQGHPAPRPIAVASALAKLAGFAGRRLVRQPTAPVTEAAMQAVGYPSGPLRHAPVAHTPEAGEVEAK